MGPKKLHTLMHNRFHLGLWVRSLQLLQFPTLYAVRFLSFGSKSRGSAFGSPLGAEAAGMPDPPKGVDNLPCFAVARFGACLHGVRSGGFNEMRVRRFFCCNHYSKLGEQKGDTSSSCKDFHKLRILVPHFRFAIIVTDCWAKINLSK